MHERLKATKDNFLTMACGIQNKKTIYQLTEFQCIGQTMISVIQMQILIYITIFVKVLNY